MEYSYCTLFNFNYLSRGLVLYDSLKEVHSDFTLFIFAFDQETESYLHRRYLSNCVIVGTKEFEDEELLKVKSERTFTEYCWTCTSSIIRYAITRYNLSSCTYLDADLYFYASPAKIFNELASFSVGITPHNYSKEYDREKVSGKYCVQFVYFKNDKHGMKALGWWRGKCLEWCYSRIEKDRFGDQKYLDFFPALFEGVYDINTPGSGIAPWNILKFGLSTEDNILMMKEKTGNVFPIIFYHFHKINIDYTSRVISLKKYYYENKVMSLIYESYLQKLLKWESTIRNEKYLLSDFKIKSITRLEILLFRGIRKITNNLYFRRLYNAIQLRLAS